MICSHTVRPLHILHNNQQLLHARRRNGLEAAMHNLGLAFCKDKQRQLAQAGLEDA